MIKINDLIDGRYRIISRIGTGGMADVYEANDTYAHSVVCLKIMKEELKNDPANLTRFENEATVGAALRSPNIVSVFGIGKIDGRPYMVNEFLRAETLRTRLAKRAYIEVEEACEIMLQLTQGISYIHRRGLIHRDIKPDNLFYLADGTVKIGDFGISTRLGEVPAGHGVQGTIYYCAPEILISKTEATRTNDIYSMGVLFYELLTGRVPFVGNDPAEIASKHLKAKFPMASKFMPSVPTSIDRIIIKATRKNPAERYQTAEEFHDAIRAAMDDKANFKPKKGILNRTFGFK